MQITMKEAILQGKDFSVNGAIYKSRLTHLVFGDGEEENLIWILNHQDIMVEVEDNYWDKQGRAIRELEDGTQVWHITFGVVDWCTYGMNNGNTKNRFNVGNCFKDKPSAEAELQRLKDKQKERIENGSK